MKIYTEIQKVDRNTCCVVARFWTDDFPQGSNWQNFEIRDSAALDSEQALVNHLVHYWAPKDWLEKMGSYAKNGPPNMDAVALAEGKTFSVEWTPPPPPAPRVLPMLPVDEV